ncbi:LAMI_0A01728g1_1 [Lachancea mirantina]|uniref:Protein LOT5 n=1 Tax=Lachancea mirantina TaxID=1230905 RepID=A0A1G4IM32_9SACH|nr:LAMI_0A01728g1_1 [Lachancea mirantina]
MLGKHKDVPVCQFTAVQPTIENVIPYTQYQQTQPRLKGYYTFEQSELPVLYGGGRQFLLGRLADLGEVSSVSNMELVDLFVLGAHMVIWIRALDRGLQIPYQRIVYHGVRNIPDPEQQNAGHALEILLNVEKDDTLAQLFPGPDHAAAGNDPLTALEYTMSTVELVLRPRYADFERHYNEEVESLFNFKDFGLNRGDTLVRNCNSAIATCMEFYSMEDDSDDEQTQSEQEFTGLGELVHENGWDAGMAMEFYGNEQVIGRKQPFSSELNSEASRKTRR